MFPSEVWKILWLQNIDDVFLHFQSFDTDIDFDGTEDEFQQSVNDNQIILKNYQQIKEHDECP